MLVNVALRHTVRVSFHEYDKAYRESNYAGDYDIEINPRSLPVLNNQSRVGKDPNDKQPYQPAGARSIPDDERP